MEVPAEAAGSAHGRRESRSSNVSRTSAFPDLGAPPALEKGWGYFVVISVIDLFA